MQCPKRPEEGTRSPGAVVIGADMGAGNLTGHLEDKQALSVEDLSLL